MDIVGKEARLPNMMLTWISLSTIAEFMTGWDDIVRNLSDPRF